MTAQQTNGRRGKNRQVVCPWCDQMKAPGNKTIKIGGHLHSYCEKCSRPLGPRPGYQAKLTD